LTNQNAGNLGENPHEKSDNNFDKNIDLEKNKKIYFSL